MVGKDPLLDPPRSRRRRTASRLSPVYLTSKSEQVTHYFSEVGGVFQRTLKKGKWIEIIEYCI